MTQHGLARNTGVPIATLQRILSGQSDPGDDRLAAIAAALDVTVAQILVGGEDDADATVQVDLFDVYVAAGPGREPLDEEPTGSWPFPRDWLQRRFGTDPRLAVVRVSGDSQEPELRDGDLVVIDRKETRIADGLHVVRVDNSLMIKRIAVEGATVRLKSANTAYSDVVIDLAADAERFAVIGRAGGAVKAL